MSLSTFFDLAVECHLLATSDRVLGELLARRADLTGDSTVALGVAVALLARARDDGHSALTLDELAAEAHDLATEISRSTPENESRCASECATLRDRNSEWWRQTLAEADTIVGRANGTPPHVAPLVLHGDLVQFRRYFDAEQRIVDRIQRSLMEGESTFQVITGGPGTGKTTQIAQLLVDTLTHAPDRRIALAAPTGKAAARLSESIRQRLDEAKASADIRARVPQDARTVHRLLGYQPDRDRFWSRAGMPLPHDLVILDEASMVDVLLMDALVSALAPHATLLLVGDQDQLASVEAGDVLGAICRAASDRVPGDPLRESVTRLTRSYRFEAHPAIGQAAAAILRGDANTLLEIFRDPALPDVRWAPPPENRAKLQALLAPLLERSVAATSPAEALAALDGFRILCAEREGTWGVSGINAEVERWLRARGTEITDRWYHGRPVMVMSNDYGTQLFNGDVGVAWVENGEMLVHFPAAQGATRALQPSRLPETQTAWAMTVHKAQGSEFTDVLVVLPARGSRVLGRELLYTAVTRAKATVQVIGDASVIAAAVTRSARRGSGLEALLNTAHVAGLA